MTRKEIEKDYDVNEYGIITSPGKFEGDMAYIPYFWDMVMNGTGEDIWEDDLLITRLTIDNEDVKEFSGILTKDDLNKEIELWEDNSGFVYGSFVSC